MTLNEVWTIYINVRRPRKNTLRDYTTVLMLWAQDLLTMDLRAITREHVLTCYNAARDKSMAQAIKLKTYLNALFEFGIQIDDEPNTAPIKNPIKYLKAMTKGDSLAPRETMLDEHTLPIFFREINRLARPERQLLQLLLFTGCRLNEIADLSWGEVDFDKNALNIPAHRRKVPFALRVVLSDVPWSIIRQLHIRARNPKPDDYVFAGVNKKAYAALVLCYKIDCRPHDLRRTFASVAPAAGVSDLMLKKLIGHRLQDQTAKYVKLMDVDAREFNRLIVDRLLQLGSGGLANADCG